MQRLKERINIPPKYLFFLLAGLLLLGCIYLFFSRKDKIYDPIPHYPPLERKLVERAEKFLNKQGLRDDQLGLYIYDLTSDEEFYSKNEQRLMPPASCTKLVTAISSIRLFGLDFTFRDSLFYQGYIEDGILYGDLLVKADADPGLWDFKELGEAIKALNVHTIYGTVQLRSPLKAPLKMHHSWSRNDLKHTQLPILFQGEEAVKRSLKEEVKAQGISFNEQAPTAPKSLNLSYIGATSHTLRDVLTPMILFSNNALAQCIWTSLNSQFRLLDPNQELPQDYLLDFIGKELKMPPYRYTLSDPSGLSPENRLSPKFLTDLLHWAYQQEDIRTFLLEEALPVPGEGERTGSLRWRMERGPAVGRVFAKTGTLNRLKTTTLSGYLLTAAGHTLAFSIMNQNMNLEDSRKFQDQLCTELTRP